MKVLGIDPGLHGALATWDGEVLQVIDVPIVKARSRGHEVNLPALVDVINHFNDPPFLFAYVERNSARPQEGISSARKSGMVEGMLLGCVAMRCRYIFRPPPTQWKKIAKLTKDKEYSRTRAIEFFPDYYKFFMRKKDHGRAEAALLAYYGFTEQIKSFTEQTKKARRRLA